MHRKIIAGYDGRGDGGGSEAIELAAALARPGATVIVATAVDLDGYHVLDRSVIEGREREARERLEAAMPAWPAGVEASAHVVKGTSPAGSLHWLAERENADLLVLGSTHQGRLGQVLMGTTAEHLLYGAPCPVAVAPHGYRRPPSGVRTIGVGYADTDESRLALGWAAEVARALEASLCVVAVVVAPPPRDPRTSMLWSAGDVGGALARLCDATRATAEAAIAALPEPVPCELVVTTDEPVRALRIAADRAAMDLLVLGSRGYGPLKTVLLGSVSGALSRSCPVPVVVIPRGAAVSFVGRAPATASEAVGGP